VEGGDEEKVRGPHSPCNLIWYTPREVGSSSSAPVFLTAFNLMRILLTADIHGNWAALQAVAGLPHDVCLCLGDLVEYGLEPGPCIAWAHDHTHYIVRGNHDHGAAQNVLVNGRTGYKYLTAVTRAMTRERLDADQLRYLSRLPISRTVTLDNTRFMLVHASPRDPLDEYAPPDVEFWGRRLQNIDADVICVGHTHHPYVLEVGDKLVINPGSVGQPRDGDPRACCAIIEDNKVDLLRIEYPVEETVTTVEQSTLPPTAKELLTEVFRTGTVSAATRARVLANGGE
jgi:putative phosphoesterase